MQALTDLEIDQALAGATDGRNALIAAMRAADVRAARFTPAELAEFGITKGSRFTLKGSPNGGGAILKVRTEDNGNVLVILK